MSEVEIRIRVTSAEYRALAERAETLEFDTIPEMLLTVVRSFRQAQTPLERAFLALYAEKLDDGLIAHRLGSTKSAISQVRRRLSLSPHPTPIRPKGFTE